MRKDIAMKKTFSGCLGDLLERGRAVIIVVYSGVWVLWHEAAWLMGPDFAYWGRIRAMRRQRDALHGELARMATLADPKRDRVSADLALLESDLRRVEDERAARRLAGIKALRRHLPPGFLENGALL